MRVHERRRDQPAAELDDPVGVVLEVRGGVVVADPDDRAVLDAEGGGVRVGGRVDVATAQQDAGHLSILTAAARTGRAPPRGRAAARARSRRARDVAVADQHRDVGGQPLGAERGGGERGGHREEDDGAAVGGGQDRAALAAGYVDADDRDVGRAAGRLDGGGQRDRVPGVGDRRRRRRRPPRSSRSASAWCGTTPMVRLGAGGLAPRPATATPTCRPRRSPRRPRRRLCGSQPGRRTRHHPRGQRRRAADVHHGQRQLGGRSSGSTAAIERPNRMA